MPCPTCSHTMYGMGEVPAVGGNPLFWCPRCGTIQSVDPGLGTLISETPKLVERCRTFARQRIIDGSPDGDSAAWRQTGIAESINTPENRT